jgi:hypothetical protein
MAGAGVAMGASGGVAIGNEDGEGRALPHLALHGEAPAVSFHDAPHDGEAEAVPARALGAEEGLEDLVEVLARDPAARIA